MNYKDLRKKLFKAFEEESKIYDHKPVPLRSKLVIAFLILLCTTLAVFLFKDKEIQDLVVEGIREFLGSQEASLGVFIKILIIHSFIDLFFFPVIATNLLIATMFGHVFGFVFALGGMIAASSVGYLLGHILGKKHFDELLGSRATKLNKYLKEADIFQVVVVRLVPVIPFNLVNLAAGASSVPFVSFLVGTIIGVSPGTFVLAVLGGSIASLFEEITLEKILYLVFAILLWVGIALATHRVVKLMQKKDKKN